MKEKKRTLLVAWFKESQWDHLKQIISDPENLGESYVEWRRQAEEHISMFRSTNGIVKKISVDTEKMLIWANENNIKLESSNLSSYAMHLFEEKFPTMVVCWYKKEQWDHLKEIVSDAEKLGESYEKWEAEAEKNIGIFRSKGQRVKKMHIDTEQMLVWAKENSIELMSSNLSSYATYLFEKQAESKSKPKTKKKIKHAKKWGGG